jgi:hypothetical protein
MVKLPDVSRRLAGVVIALLFSAACFRGSLSHAASASSPDPTHRVQTTDPKLAQQLISAGAHLIADYGSFQILGMNAVSQATVLAGSIPRPDLNLIRLNTGTIDTRMPRTSAAVPAFSGRGLRLVQFAGPILPAWRAELEADGARVVAYIPQNTYLVYGDLPVVQRLQAMAARAPHLQWEGTYEDAFKIHPQARVVGSQGRQREVGTEWFAVQMVADSPANEITMALLHQLSLEPIARSEFALEYFNVVVRLTPTSLPLVAARPEVISIMPYFPRRLKGERQAQIIAGNLTNNGALPAGPGYLTWLASKGFNQAQFDASGFVVDVTDSGVDNGTTEPNHFALHTGGDPLAVSRVVYSRLEGSPNSGSTLKGCDGHGTLNAHIVGGYDFQTVFPFVDFAGYHYGLGICPYVKIGASVIFDPNSFTTPNYQDLQARAYQSGARISNNSWGAMGFGEYDIDTQIYDALVRDAQPAGSAVATPGNQEMVIVFAAGNEGPRAGTIGPPGSGKNILSVGASENVQSFNGTDGSGVADVEADDANDVVSFSSRGPCADGRHKPDLVAPGTHVSGGVPQRVNPAETGSADSCFTGNGISGGVGSTYFPPGQQFFTASSGTSHSTPGVSGSCALLRQYFLNQSLNPPSPALTKAWLIESARYLTGTSANDSLWSDDQGMGAIDLGRAFDGVPRVWHDQVPTNTFTASGQEQLFTGHILNPNHPFRVTLAWTDAPGSTAGDAFNNDLDLIVEAGGNTYFGNVFSGQTSVQGGQADLRNNVESVFLPAGLTGTYSVRIRAANINSDGVPNFGNNLDQDFALVIYNADAALVPRVASGGATLVSEGCPPGNGVIDPGETVTIGFSLENTGLADTTNLVATLLETNGVVLPGLAQAYGAVSVGQTVVRQFSFTAAGSCGSFIQPTLLLHDGPAIIGLVGTHFTLGQYLTREILNEGFDAMTTPALPAGWAAASAAGGVAPETSALTSATFPNSVAFAEPDVRGESSLLSPLIPITTASAQISFQISYDTEVDSVVSTLAYDGLVLELSIRGAAFRDILSVGGRFVTGAYTRQLDGSGDNPLRDRQAWSGVSGGFVPVVLNLPASAAGENVQFKWRFGTDSGNFFGGTGCYLDTVQIIDGSYSCCELPLTNAGVASITQNSAGVEVGILSSAGVTYLLEFKESLSDPDWLPIAPTRAGTAGPISLLDPSPGPHRRFYRVRAYY